MNLNLYPDLPRRKDFRIGILGSGFIVDECHLVAYRKAGFNPVAIASRNEARAREVAAKHRIPQVCASYEELLADPGIEVLDIAVPPNVQLALIKSACARGTVKGILAQKPLGMNYQEALEAVVACERAGITLAVNQNMRYDHSVRAGKTLLENGTIGEPVIATIEMRGIPHWQPWQAELGWATLRIMSIHHLDTLRYWFGDPDGIFCSTRPDPRTQFPHTDGICSYILEYASGLRCIGIDDTWTGPAKEGCAADSYIRWRIEGLNGLAIGSLGWCHDPYTTPSTIQYASKGHHGFQAPVWPESWFPDAFIGTMADLLCALEDGRQPAISGRDNLKTMALVDAAYESARTRRAFSRPCETEKISRSQQESFPDGPPQPSRHARLLLDYARKEAKLLHHNFVGTEHLLLGMLQLGQGVAVDLLLGKGVALDALRVVVEKAAPPVSEAASPARLPWTPRAKKVFDIAGREARKMNHSTITTGHILLGLLEEEEGVAGRALRDLNVLLEETRQELLIS